MDTRSPLEMRALRYLARREYSRRELEQKLVAGSVLFSSEAVSIVLDKLEREGLLSAERVVEQIIHKRRARFGSQRIAQELKAKGIDEYLIDSALPSLHDTELEVALKIWQKKFGVLPDSREGRNKQMRFMMGRGFSMETIQRILAKVNEENA
jgi:regulatory protein